MKFVDSVPIEGAHITSDGYMVADVRISRVGIQSYHGSEVGRPGMDTVRIYRPETEVFKQDAMASFASLPITIDHPSEMVSARNWKRHAVGYSGEQVARDGGYVRVPLVLKDHAAVEKVGGGHRELSAGYVCELDWTAGTTPEGDAYDARQVNLKGNHIAIVKRGRAGSACRIGDSWTDPGDKETNMKTIVIDGVSIETTEDGVEKITALQTQLKDAKTAIGSRDAEISVLRGKVPDAAMLDEMVTKRNETVVVARRILGDRSNFIGKTDADIKRAAVAKQLGDAAIIGKDETYIDAAFDTLAKMAGPAPRRDAVRETLMSGGDRVIRDGSRVVHEGDNPSGFAHTQMIHTMTDAWMRPEDRARKHELEGR